MAVSSDAQGRQSRSRLRLRLRHPNLVRPGEMIQMSSDATFGEECAYPSRSGHRSRRHPERPHETTCVVARMLIFSAGSDRKFGRTPTQLGNRVRVAREVVRPKMSSGVGDHGLLVSLQKHQCVDHVLFIPQQKETHLAPTTFCWQRNARRRMTKMKQKNIKESEDTLKKREDNLRNKTSTRHNVKAFWALMKILSLAISYHFFGETETRIKA